MEVITAVRIFFNCWPTTRIPSVRRALKQISWWVWPAHPQFRALGAREDLVHQTRDSAQKFVAKFRNGNQPSTKRWWKWAWFTTEFAAWIFISGIVYSRYLCNTFFVFLFYLGVCLWPWTFKCAFACVPSYWQTRRTPLRRAANQIHDKDWNIYWQ